ncbi:MAG: hypothetical protein H6619_06420 [Deltaproteobacteria bacterium]|nr:hypothetical protein [Deltaproteobacteria bacterium]
MKIFVKILLSVAFLAPIVNASEPDTFYPVWKHLSYSDKQQFIAGYLQALEDTREVLQITKEYVQSNPEKAIQSLDKVDKLYTSRGLSSSSIVKEIDQLYQKQENRNARFSLLVNSAQLNLLGDR